jgi:hypothetical protein
VGGVKVSWLLALERCLLLHWALRRLWSREAVGEVTPVLHDQFVVARGHATFRLLEWCARGLSELGVLGSEGLGLGRKDGRSTTIRGVKAGGEAHIGQEVCGRGTVQYVRDFGHHRV